MNEKINWNHNPEKRLTEEQFNNIPDGPLKEHAINFIESLGYELFSKNGIMKIIEKDKLEKAKTDPFLCIECGESWNPVKEDKCSHCGNVIPF